MPGTNPALCNLAHGPLPLPAGEALKIIANAATGSKVAGLAFITERIKPISLGSRYTITGTITSGTVVGSVWQNMAITWTDSIPAGHYEITGFEVYLLTAAGGAAGPIASRLVLPGQTFRPGTLPMTTASPFFQTSRYLYDEVFGVLGEFDSFAMPSSLDMLDNGTATSYTAQVYLHIVRVSDAAGRPCNCA